jgi:DHA3 family macrolide efflux protein-like MFS transporter
VPRAHGHLIAQLRFDSEGGERSSTPTSRSEQCFLTSQTISLFGSMLVQCAIMWHLTLTTRSGSVMALAAVFGFLPQAVVSVFGGVWADRLNRKFLIIGADAMIATATLALALAMLAGAHDLRLIYVALVIRSVGAGIQMPAVNALLPQIVPTDKLMRVNGINATIQSAMMLVAPAAAAAVYASMSIIAVFFIDVVTAVFGIALLSLLAVPRLDPSDHGFARCAAGASLPRRARRQRARARRGCRWRPRTGRCRRGAAPRGP